MSIAVCPECGQAVTIVTRWVATGRNQSSGKVSVLEDHEHPGCPGTLCPGAHTIPS